jgi:excisionase family DNA binding protein
MSAAVWEDLAKVAKLGASLGTAEPASQVWAESVLQRALVELIVVSRLRPERAARVELFTVGEVAEQLRLHPETVYEMIRQGQLAGVAVSKGRKGVRVRALDLERFVEANTRASRRSPDSDPQPTGVRSRLPSRVRSLLEAEQ